MRKGIQRRLEALEKEERNRQNQQDASWDPLRRAIFFIKIVVLAYYVGRLEPDEGPISGWASLSWIARLLIPSAIDSSALLQEVDKRTHAAFLRLYAQVGIDAGGASERALFDALLKLANQLPKQWLERIESTCRDAIPVLQSDSSHRQEPAT